MEMEKPIDLKCPECGAKMVLRFTNKFKYRNGESRPFYGCSRFPECRATHGAHPDGKPFGVPATKEVKELRVKVHQKMDEVFGAWKTLSRQEKREVYFWLRDNAPKGHVGEMNEEDLLKTMKALEDHQSIIKK